VRILLATRSLADPGGSETYLETVALELQQLGHDLEVYAPVVGMVADRLRAAGLPVRADLAEVRAPEVVHAQHASTALRVRARLPETPMVYVCHSSLLDIEDPPFAAAPAVVVTLNDVVERRVRSSTVADRATVLRLRQPIRALHLEPDIDPIRPTPRRGLVVSHRADLSLADLRRACEAEGIELEVLGGPTTTVADPTAALLRADIVFAFGRSLLEALAVARAGFLFEDRAWGGFVTDETYAAFEASGFAAADAPPPTVERMGEELARYDPALGRTGFQLVRKHHSSRVHAVELVDAYRRAEETGPPSLPDDAGVYASYADALERQFVLTFESRSLAWKLAALDWTNHELRARVAELEDALDRTNHELRARVAELEDALDRTNHELRARVAELEDQLEAVWASRSMRLTRPLRAASSALGRARRQGDGVPGGAAERASQAS
jgi:hypothetical protein